MCGRTKKEIKEALDRVLEDEEALQAQARQLNEKIERAAADRNFAKWLTDIPESRP